MASSSSSSSALADQPEPESQGIASRCPSCLGWVSSFIPCFPLQSNSRESTSTVDPCIPDNEASTSTLALMPDNEATTMASSSSSSSAPADQPDPESQGIASRAPISTTDNEASTSTSTSSTAFHGIAPPPSTSASKRTQKPLYDVFINHRGPDVKHTLASVLYGILTGMSISVFLDSEELEYGDLLSGTIQTAMAGALLHIVIFSKGYAESPWCLAELVFMLKTGATVIPIFYHVDPTDLRWVDQGKGMYVQAFKEHQRKGRYRSQQLQEWMSALHEVSFYNGQIIQTKEDEMRLQKNIVRRVLQEINDKVPLVVANHPVGLEEIVQDFKENTLKSVEGDQNAQIVGIWGMGGSGKTTLAKELYNQISSSMDRSSFVFHVRDAATKGLLHDKQAKLLSDLGVQGLLPFDNFEQGMRILSESLSSLRVLIVCDDVDNMEQLDALLPIKDSLGKNSLIIVTTRNHGVLKSWGISSIYKIKPLDPLYAKQLFCWHAFMKPYPPGEFEELVENFVEVCNGLPLFLKVFGAQLYGNFSKEHWEAQLHKISRILPDDIKRRLQISYDSLEDEEKEMFLDIACFLIGQKSTLAIDVWTGLDWRSLKCWEMLLNKCLVELDSNNLIRMHDHLRDLGRDIANQQSPCRIWSPQQIINIQHQIKGKIGIKGIIATSSQIHWNIYEAEAIPVALPLMFEKIEELSVSCLHGKLIVNANRGIWPLALSLIGLKYLVISGDSFNQIIGEVSSELVWLRWFRIGQRKLPSELSVKRLRVLEFYEESYRGKHDLEELWGETGGEVPLQLRELLISNCHKFQGFPKSIGHLSNLKNIVITGGNNVKSLPEEFCRLESLEYLVLTDCMTLSSLPNNFGNLRNLRLLDLSSCSQLRRVPVSFKNLRLLEHLNLRQCRNLTFPSEDLDFLENITKLELLSLSRCEQLKELPRHITNQASLRELYFGNTILKEFPDNIDQLSRLEKMKIERVMLTNLPPSLGDLSSLTSLSIYYCSELLFLPESIGDLSSLTDLSIQKCHNLKRLPDSIRHLLSLTDLSIQNCSNLEYCPSSLGDLSCLTNLTIINCPKLSLDSFEQLTNLEKLNSSLGKRPSSLPELYNPASLRNINLKSDSKQNSQVSYYELDEEEREMFLDAACFLIGEKKSRAIAVWDGSGWRGLHGLQSLEKKCLVELVDDSEYDGEKIIRMHDHLRDMGRQIANIKSPYRIWSPKQIIHMERHSMDTEPIRGILGADVFLACKEYILHPARGSSRQSLSTLLQILFVVGNAFSKELVSVSADLVWLRWEGFPLGNLPSWLPFRNLRVLELHGANELEGLWEDKEHAPLQLRELIITGTGSASFRMFPSSISYLKLLRKIALLGDVGKEFGIKELPEEFCNLQSLEQLELRHCTLLSSLPARFGDLRNLRHLDLCSCKALRMLPVSFQRLALLSYLDLSGCKRLLLQKDILKDIPKLKNLYLSGCLALQKIPHQITDLACLRELRLKDTHLDDLPNNIGQLGKLEVLTIGSPLLKNLPDSFGNLSSLKILSIIDCLFLECLPDTFGHLVLLEDLCIEGTGVRSLPEGFRQLANLRTFKVSDCPLSELDFGFASSFSLEKLTDINLSETLVTRISVSGDCCPRLETLQLSKNKHLKVIETLPATVKYIELLDCKTLNDILGILALPITPTLRISDCPELEKPSES